VVFAVGELRGALPVAAIDRVICHGNLVSGPPRPAGRNDPAERRDVRIARGTVGDGAEHTRREWSRGASMKTPSPTGNIAEEIMVVEDNQTQVQKFNSKQGKQTTTGSP